MAERLALSLRGDGYAVFFDKSDIEAGEEYDSRIRKAIEACDLFVFLISPESLALDSYPLAELGIAERRWPHPEGHVLPLVVKPVPIDSLPPYLRAVSVFDPQGDFVAESSAAIARIAKTKPGLLRPALWAIAATVVIAAGFLGWNSYHRSQQDREVRAHERVPSAGEYGLSARGGDRQLLGAEVRHRPMATVCRVLAGLLDPTPATSRSPHPIRQCFRRFFVKHSYSAFEIRRLAWELSGRGRLLS